MTSLTVIFGNGRGKTSSAIGFLYRKITEERKIIVVQFLKTGKNCGECNFFESFPNVMWYCFGKKEFYHKENKKEFQEIIEAGYQQLREEVINGGFDILILDEVGIALFYDLIKWEEMKDLFQFVKEEVIITGRKVPDIVLENASTSILVKEIKHPYNVGIQARQGIDY
ncbi:MAG: cob(I)yrinic acid a,c-diamide adenosyltransferase [Candidatus Heimdallarchaeaceae archaeon]